MDSSGSYILWPPKFLYLYIYIYICDGLIKMDHWKKIELGGTPHLTKSNMTKYYIRIEPNFVLGHNFRTKFFMQPVRMLNTHSRGPNFFNLLGLFLVGWGGADGWVEEGDGFYIYLLPMCSHWFPNMFPIAPHFYPYYALAKVELSYINEAFYHLALVWTWLYVIASSVNVTVMRGLFYDLWNCWIWWSEFSNLRHIHQIS